MFTFKANLFFVDVYRSKPITPPFYRPLLIFSNELKLTGEIPIHTNEILAMNKYYDDREVSILFHQHIDANIEFYLGRNFVLKEGVIAVMGIGKITQIIGFS